MVNYLQRIANKATSTGVAQSSFIVAKRRGNPIYLYCWRSHEPPLFYRYTFDCHAPRLLNIPAE